MFTIDDENNITAGANEANALQFANIAEFEAFLRNQPSDRLVAIWNTLPGVKPTNKFTSRETGVCRITKAVRKFIGKENDAAPAPVEAAAENVATSDRMEHKKKPATIKKRAAKTERALSAVKEGSKAAKAVALLSRAGGVTLAQLSKAMDWLPHTTRSFVSAGLAKKGIKVNSFKTEKGERAYAIAA